MKPLLIALICLLMLGCDGEAGTPSDTPANTPAGAAGGGSPEEGGESATTRPTTYDAPEEAYEAYMQAMNDRDWEAVARTLEPTSAYLSSTTLGHYISQNIQPSPENLARGQELDQLAPTDTSVAQADRYNVAAYETLFEILVGDRAVVVLPVENLEEQDSDEERFEARWIGAEVWEVDGRQVRFRTDIVYSQGSWWILGWAPNEMQRALERE